MRRVVAVCCLLLATDAVADFIWHYLPDASFGTANFNYTDPGTAERFVLDVNGYFGYTGSVTYGDDIDLGGGVYRADILDFNISYSDVFGARYRATPAPGGQAGYAIVDLNRPAPDIHLGSDTLIEIFQPPDLVNPVSTSFIPQGPQVNFALFNTDGFRDPDELPLDPLVENYLDTLVPTLGGVAGLLNNVLSTDTNLPSNWTGLATAALSSSETVVFDRALIEGSFGIDATGIEGVTINGDGTISIPINSQTILTAYTTDGFPSIIDVDLPGEVGNPLLPTAPTADCPDGFCFVFEPDPSQITFIDPEIAIGYTYEVTGAEFASVLLPDVGDGLFDLFLYDALLDEFFDAGIELTAGVEYFFGDGVSRFQILGIEVGAGLDPDDETAFVTGLTFDQPGMVTVNQTALSVFVPEPATGMLIGLGLAGLAFSAARRRIAEAAA